MTIPDSSNKAVQSREILDLMVPTFAYLRSHSRVSIEHASKTSRKAAIFRRRPADNVNAFGIAAPKDTGQFFPKAFLAIYLKI